MSSLKATEFRPSLWTETIQEEAIVAMLAMLHKGRIVVAKEKIIPTVARRIPTATMMVATAATLVASMAATRTIAVAKLEEDLCVNYAVRLGML